MKNRKQREVLNGQASFWVDDTAGAPQKSINDSLLSLSYINDLSDALSSNTKIFADDIFSFSRVHNKISQGIRNIQRKDKFGRWVSNQIS